MWSVKTDVGEYFECKCSLRRQTKTEKDPGIGSLVVVGLEIKELFLPQLRDVVNSSSHTALECRLATFLRM